MITILHCTIILLDYSHTYLTNVVNAILKFDSSTDATVMVKKLNEHRDKNESLCQSLHATEKNKTRKKENTSTGSVLDTSEIAKMQITREINNFVLEINKKNINRKCN